MRALSSSRANPISLSLNLKHREVVVHFAVDLAVLGETNYGAGIGEWKFAIPFTQMGTIYIREGDPNRKELVIPAKNPPKWYRKVSDPTSTMSDSDDQWSGRQAWLRQTDVYAEQDALRLLNSPLNLHKPNPFIDIGRLSIYTDIFRTCIY